MKETALDPLGLLEIDVDIHYDLDMSKFPGLEEPENLREPALLISSQKLCETWFDVITKCEYVDDDGDEDNNCVDDDDDDVTRDDDGCAFCDALNVLEENDNCSHLTEPCYISESVNTLYFFDDIHECETIEVTDNSQEPSVYLQCGEDQLQEKTYWLNTSSMENSICVPEVEIHCENVPPVYQDISLTQLTACEYPFNDNHDVSPSSPYMDMCITEQLPLFIDLVDQLSPVLSPSGHVRSRKGDNSVEYCGDTDSLTYFLASDEGLLTIDTSMTPVNHVITREATVFPRGS